MMVSKMAKNKKIQNSLVRARVRTVLKGRVLRKSLMKRREQPR
jgi:hypothetical protein